MTDETKKCPHCGQEILTVAKKCKYCKQFVADNVEISTNSENESSSDNQTSKEYLTKKEIDDIKSKINFIKSYKIVYQIFEFIGLFVIIYYLFTGGSIAEITGSVCYGILAIYFRIKIIHNDIEIQSLKREIEFKIKGN